MSEGDAAQERGPGATRPSASPSPLTRSRPSVTPPIADLLLVDLVSRLIGFVDGVRIGLLISVDDERVDRAASALEEATRLIGDELDHILAGRRGG